MSTPSFWVVFFYHYWPLNFSPSLLIWLMVLGGWDAWRDRSDCVQAWSKQKKRVRCMNNIGFARHPEILELNSWELTTGIGHTWVSNAIVVARRSVIQLLKFYFAKITRPSSSHLTCSKFHYEHYNYNSGGNAKC